MYAIETSRPYAPAIRALKSAPFRAVLVSGFSVPAIRSNELSEKDTVWVETAVRYAKVNAVYVRYNPEKRSFETGNPKFGDGWFPIPESVLFSRIESGFYSIAVGVDLIVSTLIEYGVLDETEMEAVGFRWEKGWKTDGSDFLGYTRE